MSRPQHDMDHGAHPPVSYVAIWALLVGLLGVGVLLLVLPLSGVALVVLIFTAAAIKAGLVVRHYMHLRAQPWMMYAIVGVPVLLGIAMVLALIPDIGLRP
jgi:caa(3)-type oxidase subunit IV